MKKYKHPEFELILLSTEIIAAGEGGVSDLPDNPIGPEIPPGGEGGGIDNPFPDEDEEGSNSITWSWGE